MKCDNHYDVRMCVCSHGAGGCRRLRAAGGWRLLVAVGLAPEMNCDSRDLTRSYWVDELGRLTTFYFFLVLYTIVMYGSK